MALVIFGAAVIVAAAAVLCLDTGFRVPIFAVLIGALGLHAILTGRRLTAMLVVAFCGALVFHAALGLVDGLRIYTGYEVLLVAAFVMAVSEKPHTASPKPRQLSGVSIIVFVLILVGYTGNYWLRSGYKAGLRQALASPHTAMKISGNLPLDRSLYMRGDGVEFYTRYDPLPFGTGRHYGRLDTPEGIGCPTFIHPCFVEWN